MTFTVSGAIVTQSGTDANLSGMAGLTGVTSFTNTLQTWYKLPEGAAVNPRLLVTGDLTIDGITTGLVTPGAANFSAPPQTWPVVLVNSGASLTLGKKTTLADGSIKYSDGLLASLGRDNTRRSQSTTIETSAGSNFYAYGGEMVIGSGGMELKGAVTVEKLLLYCTGVDASNGTIVNGYGNGAQFRFRGTSCNVKGLILDGDSQPTSFFSDTAQNIQRMEVELRNSFFQTFNGLATAMPLTNYACLNNRNSYDLWAERGVVSGVIPTTGQAVVVNNCDRGTAVRCFGRDITLFPTNGSFGTFIIQQQVAHQALDTAEQPIDGFVTYVASTNRGDRVNKFTASSFQFQAGYDFTQPTWDKYINVGASGLTSAYTMLTGVVFWYNSVESSFVYGKTATRGEDKFDVWHFKYGKKITQVALVAKGLGTQTTKAFMLDDAAVTLSEAAAGALTTLASLSDLYDRATWYKCQATAANLEYPTLATLAITADGAALDGGGRTLVVDAAAASPYAPAGSVITVKASTLAATSKFKSLKNVLVQAPAAAVSGIDIAGTLETARPFSFTGRTITKLVLTSGTGDVTLTNCTVGEIENRSGTAVTLYLIGTATPTLTATNGAINLATVLSFSDVSGGAFTLIAVDFYTKSVIRAYNATAAGTVSFDVGGATKITLAAHKDGCYTLVRTIDVAGAASYQLAFNAIPYTDFTEGFAALEADMVTSIAMYPYPGITALIKNEFQSAHAAISQNQFKLLFASFQGRMPAMQLLAQANTSADNVFETTAYGVKIKQPVIQLTTAGNFEVSTLAYVENAGVLWGGGAVPTFNWQPENASNRKVTCAPVPLILSTNIGVEETPSAAQNASAVRAALLPDLAVINGGVKNASLLIPHAADLAT